MAMKMTRRMFSTLGYPVVSRIFAVISSRTPSPNINSPTIATEASTKNYGIVSANRTYTE